MRGRARGSKLERKTYQKKKELTASSAGEDGGDAGTVGTGPAEPGGEVRRVGGGTTRGASRGRRTRGSKGTRNNDDGARGGSNGGEWLSGARSCDGGQLCAAL